MALALDENITEPGCSGITLVGITGYSWIEVWGFRALGVLAMLMRYERLAWAHRAPS